MYKIAIASFRNNIQASIAILLGGIASCVVGRHFVLQLRSCAAPLAWVYKSWHDVSSAAHFSSWCGIDVVCCEVVAVLQNPLCLV